jgi:hypothetical protein
MDQGWTATFESDVAHVLPFLRRVWWPYRFAYAAHHLLEAIAHGELRIEHLQERERTSRQMVADIQVQVAAMASLTMEPGFVADIGRHLAPEIRAWRDAAASFAEHASERQVASLVETLGTLPRPTTPMPTAADRATLQVQRDEMATALRDIIDAQLPTTGPLEAATFAMGEAYLQGRREDGDSGSDSD